MENTLRLLTEQINKTEFIISEAKKIGIDKLQFGLDSLDSFINKETMDVHYNGHYKTYVKKLNDALSKKNYGDVELEDIIKSISKYNQTIRNNAGGAFNHALFWKMLTPNKQDIPSEIKNKITKNRNLKITKTTNKSALKFKNLWNTLKISLTPKKKKNTLKIS